MEDLKAPKKAKLVEVNSHLTCYLCKGYYIDATTIVECLHSFCRSCIILFLQANSYCPICEMMINTAKPNIKPDKTLQDIVYKLVPGLYASEMCRRRRFWAEHPKEAQKVSCPEARGHTTERIIFSPQDAISLSIEYTCDDQPDWNRNKAITGSDTDQEIPLRRYLQCPAMLRVEHLKKFICNKYNVDNILYHVEILHKRVPLPDHYTLMDIAYIYSWKRNEPMKFFFRITEMHLVSERFDYLKPSNPSAVSSPQHTPARCQKSKHNTDKKETAAKVDRIAATIARKTEDNNTCDKVKNSELKTRRDEVNKSVSKRTSAAKDCVKSASDSKLNNKVQHKRDSLLTSVNKTELKSNTTDNQKKHSELKTKSSDNCKEKREDAKKMPVNKVEIKNPKQINYENSVNISSKTDTNTVKKEAVSSKIKIDAALENTSVTSTKLVTSISDSNCSSSKATHQTEILKTNENTKKYKQSAQKVMKLSIEKDSSNKSPEKSKISESFSKRSDIPPKLPKRPPPKLEEVSISREDPDLEAQKCHFFNSIQLTAKSSLLQVHKSETPEITITKTLVPRQKNSRKFDKSPNSDKLEPPNKILKTLLHSSSDNSESDVELKAKDIKNPVVRNIVSNVNRQVTNLTKIVGQADSSKTSEVINQANQNERLKSLIDSCKLNIPSSLSITLTESPRNEDGSIVEPKPATIKPVQNYIEILKLPDTNSNNQADNTADIIPKTENLDEALKHLELNKQNLTSQQKHTFQTMFEEAVRRKQSVKLHLYRIQVQALKAELARKTAKYTASIVKKQHNYALDLSQKPSDTPDSTIPSTNLTLTQPSPSPSPSPVPSANPPSLNSSKRNILEIAHQLSKRSKLETALTSHRSAPPQTSRSSSPPQASPTSKEPRTSSSSTDKQIIINNNFNCGGSMSILDQSKKNANTTSKLPLPKLPIPRLPVHRHHRGRGAPATAKNGNLLKLNNISNKLNTNFNSLSKKSTSADTLQNNVDNPIPLLEKYNISNLAQFSSNFNQAQLAYQQALLVSHQLELQRFQQNTQKHWLPGANLLAHYENYVQTLKNQQNQKCGNNNNQN